MNQIEFIILIEVRKDMVELIEWLIVKKAVLEKLKCKYPVWIENHGK